MSDKRINFFKQVFIKKDEEDSSIKLGNYSNRNKTENQIKYWKDAYNQYKKKNFLSAAKNFLLFLKDPKFDNTAFEKTKNKINYYFYQGSKKISGYIDEKIIYAYSDIVVIHSDKHIVAERLLKINYGLKFCKFSLDKDKVVCELFLHTPNSNPSTLFYALREIALTSDRYDDVLMMDFLKLSHINNSHVLDLQKNELDIKISYFKKWTTQVLKDLNNYDPGKFTNARSFLILSYLYKIIHLLSPEGELLENIKKTINIFYNEQFDIDSEKNTKIVKLINSISEKDDKTLSKSFYFAYSTFSTVPPSEPRDVINFIKKEINKINWYENNKHNEISIAVTDYIIGYCCYNFGNEQLIDELFKIYWKTMYNDFFNDLKIKQVPVEKNRINYFILNNSINSVNWIAKKTYPNFNFNIKHLNIVNTYEFAKSFIYEFINLNFYKSNN